MFIEFSVNVNNSYANTRTGLGEPEPWASTKKKTLYIHCNCPFPPMEILATHLIGSVIRKLRTFVGT